MERLTPEQEIEATLFGLHAERNDFWLGLRARVERSGGKWDWVSVNGSRELRLIVADPLLRDGYGDSYERMDTLLDKYSGQLAMQECFDNLVVVGDVVA